jgi:hypothetical protein
MNMVEYGIKRGTADYKEVNDSFICYANESVLPKRFIIPDDFEYLEFWVTDENGDRISEEKIKRLKVEMVLETAPGKW